MGKNDAVSLEGLSEAVLARANPLRHEGMSIDQAEKHVRMKRVLGAMSTAQVDLLFERYVERRTLDEMAEDRGVTRQAVLKRLKTAKLNFIKSFEANW